MVSMVGISAGNTSFAERERTEDEQLLKRMTTRDEVALSEFYDRHHRLVYSLVLRIVGSPSDAEDVVVDVFWEVWRRAGQYNPGRSGVLTWLATLARSRAIDRWRQERRPVNSLAVDISEADQSENMDDPGDPLFLVDQRRKVRGALNQLPALQRQAIELAYFRGMSQSEIAAALGEPLGTVKTRIHTGMAHLRESLRDCL